MIEHTIQKARYNWVDYSKGICILAVVTYYSARAAKITLGDVGAMQYWVDFAAPFRMPDFFLLSGLFLSRVIDRPWKNYIDKKIIHYGYFFLLWSGICLLLLVAIGEVSGGVKGMITRYWSMISSWPFHMLWFIQMLPAYFLFTRLVKSVPVWLMLLIAIALHSYQPFETGRIIIDEFWHRYVFFYVGYVFSSRFFQLADWVEQHTAKSVFCLVAWIIVNGAAVYLGVDKAPLISIALGLAGAMAVVVVAVLLEKQSVFNWVRYLGENSLIVYLGFYWPMILASHILISQFPVSGYNGLFTVLVSIAGIAGSVLVFQLVRRIQWMAWLFRRPRWAVIS